jgi:hypothetical protein
MKDLELRGMIQVLPDSIVLNDTLTEFD